MEKDKECVFSDKSVTLSQFLDGLATQLAIKMVQVEKGTLEITQAKAYKMFGRGDVDRWKKSGKLKPVRVSPGKIRYKLIDLQKLSKIQQNYLID